ncbi:MAG: hypothetical protein ACI9Y8_001679 [Candidatus Omnitrophota bacterium]|jgi:hypothetical protein
MMVEDHHNTPKINHKSFKLKRLSHFCGILTPRKKRETQDDESAPHDGRRSA